jgi:hypothetical protein
MCIHISGFHSITSVTLDKLCQGFRNFSEQTFRFPWHQMKFTINWWFCPHRSNQHRSRSVLHSRLPYWWTVILSNRNKWGKHAQHNNKQGPHSLFIQTGILPSSSCVSIKIYNLTSQIYIEWCRLCCFMGYSEIASGCGFPLHWRPWGDCVDRDFEGIWYQSNIFLIFYESQKITQRTRSREVVNILIWNPDYVFSSIAKSSRKCSRFFNPPLAFCGLLSHVRKIVSLMFVSFFIYR